MAAFKMPRGKIDGDVVSDSLRDRVFGPFASSLIAAVAVAESAAGQESSPMANADDALASGGSPHGDVSVSLGSGAVRQGQRMYFLS